MIIFVSHLFPLNLDFTVTFCLDIDYKVVFVNKVWLLSHLFHKKISTISIFLKVKEIKASKYKSAQFATLFLFFPSKNETRKQVYISIKCNLYLVNGFQTNILVENNILLLESLMINVKKNCILGESFKIRIAMNIKQRRQLFKKKLLIGNNNIVSLCSKVIILFMLVFLSNDRNFMFYPITQANLTLYTHIVDYITTKILVNNIFNCLLRIL